MAFREAGNGHEIFPQSSRGRGESRRIAMDGERRDIVNGMSDRSECITSEPFTIPAHQKASRAIDVLLAGRFIHFPKRKPGHLGKVMVYCVIVIVQNQLGIVKSYTVRGGKALCTANLLIFTRNLPANRNRCAGTWLGLTVRSRFAGLSTRQNHHVDGSNFVPRERWNDHFAGFPFGAWSATA